MKKTVTAMKGIQFPHVRQIGIVVGDMKYAITHYSNILGLNPWFRSRFIEQGIDYHGKRIRLDLEVLLAFSGGVEIELIEVKSGDENIYTSILNDRGGGIHHVGYFVKDFTRSLEALQSSGIQPLQQGTLKTAGGAVTRFAYLDTLHQCGIITEIIETKLGPFRVPHAQFMMHIAALSGDMEKIMA